MEENIIVDISSMDHSWADKELINAELGDQRLVDRLVLMTKAFASHPQANIPQAMGDWANSKAAYRFFDNSKVVFEKRLEPHTQKTRQRSTTETILLAIQDTSFIDYTNHPITDGLGFLNDEKHRGYLLHPTLAVSTKGVPLGIIDSHIIMRESIGVKKDRAIKPIEEKESFKWLHSYRKTAAFSSSLENTRVVNVSDREADIYEYFADVAEHKKLISNAPDVLVRASSNRRIEESEKHIWQHVASQKIAATFNIDVPRKKDQKGRVATLSIRYSEIMITPPLKFTSKKVKPVLLYAVYAHEENPPKGIKPISWMLLTTVAITNASQAIETVGWYVCRWVIELYFKVLKSGCNIEERQLETSGRLLNCLAIDSIIAWRILFATMIGREIPELPATVLFEASECNALYTFIEEEPVFLETMPLLGDMIRKIAKLGGFLARKSDENPGIICIWRGMWRLADIYATWKIYNKKNNSNTKSQSSPANFQTYG